MVTCRKSKPVGALQRRKSGDKNGSSGTSALGPPPKHEFVCKGQLTSRVGGPACQGITFADAHAQRSQEDACSENYVARWRAVLEIVRVSGVRNLRDFEVDPEQDESAGRS